MEELEALVIFNHIPELGLLKAKKLLEQFGSAKAALQSADKSWEKLNTWKKDLELIATSGIKLIPFTDPRYPKRLLELKDHPLILYVKGELLPSDHNAVTIVGTRQCSLYGRDIAHKMAKELAAQGYTVVSNLALGCNTAVHMGAIETGRTIAVIGSGLKDVFPKENIALTSHIARNGAVISEFPMNAPPEKNNFLKRDRLLGALSQAVLLTEAPIRSSAMVTMKFAEAQGKPCFALPGRPDIETFLGNQILIKEKKACLIENTQDLLSFLKKGVS